MPAVDPQGSMSHWLKGKPFLGLQRTGTATEATRYWLNGLLEGYMFPEMVIGPKILSVADLTYATDVASVAGVEVDFVRKIAGVNAQ